MTQALSAFSRLSALSDRHRALGTAFEASWNDMPVPQNYASDTYDEVIAVRTAAGLFDVSALRIIDVAGKEALAVLNETCTSDISKIAPGASSLTSVVDENGSLIDDVLIYCDGPDAYRISHGGGSLEDILPGVAAGRDVTFTKDNDVHILSLQGPKALDILNPNTPFALETLPYFGHQRTTLFGRPVSIARGGYSGERGYEVFCAAADAVALWDAILAAGRPVGAMAVSWSCLDVVRVEGGLLFFPYDMPQGDTTPWEVGLGWTVDLSKPAFRGRDALVRRKGQERVAQVGVEIDHHAAVEPGAKLFRDGKEVGVVNSTAYSRYLMRSLALAHVTPDLAAFGTELEVRGADGTFAARVVKTPFYDPLRLRTHPLEERTA
ncbi:aminomethyltransferase family protein [Xanthobacter autotrophicus]|uniref:aminomethyltransferase family protein n=1 Tax=Xanthobacter autotrophicus TaxID=280 RepID=UPI001E551CD1|nr:aminomethyltransferase family protein [Xanthobacter autotrophicus]UDQ90070.1 aminomethyltransferase family protein [Xanthobacter autotrophicus]